MERQAGTIMDLEWDISARLRYSHDPKLGLELWSTRDDVRRVRDLIPHVRGIGAKRLAEIDRWLNEQVETITANQQQG